MSLRHIQAALAKPTWLRITVPSDPPTYRVEVREHPYYIEKPYHWNFGTGGYASRYAAPSVTPSFTPPLVTVGVWHAP